MALDYVTLLDRLKELINDAGRNYYERVKIADQLLSNKVWMESAYGGDDYKDAEMLEREYFHDLSGSMSIFELLQIYRKFNNEGDWKKHNYNLKVLYAQCKKVESSRSRTTVKLADFEAVQAEAAEFKFKYKENEKQLKIKMSCIEKLEERVRELENENAELRGRVNELERVLHGKLAAV